MSSYIGGLVACSQSSIDVAHDISANKDFFTPDSLAEPNPVIDAGPSNHANGYSYFDDVVASDSGSIDLDSETLTTQESVNSKFLDALFELLSINAPDWYINPDFKIAFSDRSDFDSITDTCKLSLSSEAASMLSSSGPPRYKDFLKLPAPRRSTWAVYVVCVESDDGHQAVYVGSGTHAEKGVLNRVQSYTNPASSVLPRHVGIAFKRGHRLAHVGIICSIDLPSPGLVPRARGLILAAETYSSIVFFAIFPMITDSWVDHLQLWSRDNVAIDWAPLCSHLALSEGIRGDLQITSEELEIASAARRARIRSMDRVYIREYRKQDWVRAHRMKNQIDLRAGPAYEDKRRVYAAAAAAKWYSALGEPSAFEEQVRAHESTVAARISSKLDDPLTVDERARVYRDTMSATKPSYDTKETREKLAKRSAKNRSLAHTLRRYECSPCDKTFGEQSALQKHILTQAHINKMNGIDAAPVTKAALGNRQARQQKVIDAVYRCGPCNKNFPNDWSLTRHQETGLHGRRLEKFLRQS